MYNVLHMIERLYENVDQEGMMPQAIFKENNNAYIESQRVVESSQDKLCDMRNTKENKWTS